MSNIPDLVTTASPLTVNKNRTNLFILKFCSKIKKISSACKKIENDLQNNKIKINKSKKAQTKSRLSYLSWIIKKISSDLYLRVALYLLYFSQALRLKQFLKFLMSPGKV